MPCPHTVVEHSFGEDRNAGLTLFEYRYFLSNTEGCDRMRYELLHMGIQYEFHFY